MLVERSLDGVRWMRDTIGASPRPILAFLGVPALVWGTHMRARRRQGWWVCAFGVTATIPLAQGLLDPAGSFVEAGLVAAYSLVPGLLLGYLVVRADLALCERVQPGVVYTTFHFPESGANVITTDSSDWATNCPEYKVTAVQVLPVVQPSAWQQEYSRFNREQLAHLEAAAPVAK